MKIENSGNPSSVTLTKETSLHLTTRQTHTHIPLLTRQRKREWEKQRQPEKESESHNTLSSKVKRMDRRYLVNINKNTNIKITYIWRRCGKPPNFFLVFIDELEKETIIKKKVLSGPIKNKIILIFTMLHFFKKNKEKHLYISLSKSQWYDLQSLRYRAKHIETGNFSSFFALLPLPPPLMIPKIKILKKNEKNAWRYYHFAHVYHKWKSYDAWLLRYGAWGTEFFYTNMCTINKWYIVPEI